MKKRRTMYIQKPQVYAIRCDLCNGDNIDWSEYEHKIWCYDCKKDTRGDGGVFDGPIPLHASNMMGICFDKVNLRTGKRLYLTEKDGHLFWRVNKPWPKDDPQYIK